MLKTTIIPEKSAFVTLNLRLPDRQFTESIPGSRSGSALAAIWARTPGHFPVTFTRRDSTPPQLSSPHLLQRGQIPAAMLKFLGLHINACSSCRQHANGKKVDRLRIICQSISAYYRVNRQATVLARPPKVGPLLFAQKIILDTILLTVYHMTHMSGNDTETQQVRLRYVPQDVVRLAKSKAALLGQSLEDFLTELIKKALKDKK